MKPIDILARDLKEWPWSTGVVGQASDGKLHLNHASRPCRGFSDEAFEMADDWMDAHVTRAEWQAAVDALNKAAWNGEGIPPVGAEFERRFVDEESSSWAWGQVLAHGKRRIFYVDRTGDEWAHALADLEFRPIRTPEQVGKEERETRIRALARSIEEGGWRTPEMLAAYLDSHGYRKQVQS